MQKRWLWWSGFHGHHPLRKRRLSAVADRRLMFQARPQAHPQGDKSMQWTTPTATDFRFGFEITMYVSAR
jgi:coenzyme PQQ precursor peptide PqqA